MEIAMEINTPASMACHCPWNVEAV